MGRRQMESPMLSVSMVPRRAWVRHHSKVQVSRVYGSLRTRGQLVLVASRFCLKWPLLLLQADQPFAA